MKVCSFPGCGRKSLAHDLCDGHNKQRIRRGFLTPLGLTKKKICATEGCDEYSVAHGLCRKHYRAQKSIKPIVKRIATRCQYCARQAMQEGLCGLHLAELKKFGNVGPRWGTDDPGICSTPGCVRPVYAKGMCRNCWSRTLRIKNQFKSGNSILGI